MKNKYNGFIAFGISALATIALILISGNEEVNNSALILACTSFLGAILNLLYWLFKRHKK